MKKTRRDRKMYNEGKRDGYLEGYKQGVHDGNPFNAFAEACNKMAEHFKKALFDPDVIQAISELKEVEEEKLIIEGRDENDTERNSD